MTTTTKKQRKGFAVIDPARVREIARLGGQAAHDPKPGKKRGHEWTSEEACEAGRKGGSISRGGRGRAPEPTPLESPAELQA